MKKFVVLVLAISISLMMVNVCFAAPEDTTLLDQEVPGAQLENVDTATYEEPIIEIFEDEVPAGQTDAVSQVVEIADEEVPKDLPKTGGIPAEAFYAVGGLFVVAGLVLSRKKANT